MGKLEGKVAIITGGGKGIGFGLAKAFAKEGANLTITGRTMSRLEAAKEKLEAEYGVKVLPITADGADEASVANVVKQTVETFGHIDTVVNNAQVSKSGTVARRVSGSVCQDDSGDSAGALCRSGEGYRPRLRVPRVGRRVLCHGRNHHAPGRQRSASVRKSKIIQRETEEIPLPFFF